MWFLVNWWSYQTFHAENTPWSGLFTLCTSTKTRYFALRHYYHCFPTFFGTLFLLKKIIRHTSSQKCWKKMKLCRNCIYNIKNFPPKCVAQTFDNVTKIHLFSKNVFLTIFVKLDKHLMAPSNRGGKHYILRELSIMSLCTENVAADDVISLSGLHPHRTDHFKQET